MVLISIFNCKDNKIKSNLVKAPSTNEIKNNDNIVETTPKENSDKAKMKKLSTNNLAKNTINKTKVYFILYKTLIYCLILFDTILLENLVYIITFLTHMQYCINLVFFY